MRFRADGLQVWKEPEPTKSGFKLGYVVCQVNDNLIRPEGIAKAIAEIMNKHWPSDDGSTAKD